jgi:hypothetical protein
LLTVGAWQAKWKKYEKQIDALKDLKSIDEF